MTRQEAIKKLKETKNITTKMLKPLGISFDAFLHWSQKNKTYRDLIVKKYIKTLNN